MLTIGELARRTGLTVSAIRFYEEKGLVRSARTSGNQRRFARADIRRLSFILIAQRAGFSLDRIESELASLPQQRNPDRADWARIANQLQDDIGQQIAMLQRMRDRLDGCIGCGCLSLDTCQLYNHDDHAGRSGSGPRYLLGDLPSTSPPPSQTESPQTPPCSPPGPARRG